MRTGREVLNSFLKTIHDRYGFRSQADQMGRHTRLTVYAGRKIIEFYVSPETMSHADAIKIIDSVNRYVPYR